jgi:NAD(P)-dependent dehydrogenase (short-subunit alcohol dehydrogenase family)
MGRCQSPGQFQARPDELNAISGRKRHRDKRCFKFRPPPWEAHSDNRWLSGIGRAIASAMAAEGGIVTIMDRSNVAREDGAGAEEVCRRIGQDVRWFRGDVASERDVENVFRAAGRFDVLVNNAGVSTFKPIQNCTVDDFDRLMSVNVKGVFLTTRAAVDTWIREARTGAIVNVASNLAFVGAPSAGIYCATKGAVATFTKAIAAEVGPRGIRVNMVCPGPVETEFNREYREGGAQREWEQATPLRNVASSILADPARIAPAAVFLASDEARHITGAALLVDGGMNSI